MSKGIEQEIEEEIKAIEMEMSDLGIKSAEFSVENDPEEILKALKTVRKNHRDFHERKLPQRFPQQRTA